MAVAWKVEFTASARREFKILGAAPKQSAVQVLQDLTEDAVPATAIPLRGYASMYRIRFYRDRFRLIYWVSEKQRRVIVTRVRPRGTAYIGMRGEL